MKAQGHLRKMQVENKDLVEYHMVIDNQTIHLNPYIGEKISITFLDEIHCMACGKLTNKSYNQGYCYKCFKTLALNDRCIMAPEHCHYDKGTCREPEWGEKYCMKPHVVYLSWTSGIKVGLSRLNNRITRWMDQGATHAITVCQTESRYQAGLVEDHLRQWYRDRTQWKSMLQAEYDERIDLLSEHQKVLDHLQDFKVTPVDPEVHHFHYPVEAIGDLSIITLNKQKNISGHLLGIKGQYLILDSGVVNIRAHTSYLVDVSLG